MNKINGPSYYNALVVFQSITHNENTLSVGARVGPRADQPFEGKCRRPRRSTVQPRKNSGR